MKLCKIPNVAFARVNNRSIVRLMFPGMYGRGQTNSERIVSDKKKEILYDRAIRPAVMSVLHEGFEEGAVSQGSHWPASHALALAMVKQGRQLSKQLSWACLPSFSAHLMENLTHLGLPEFRGAFFYHEIQGVKLAHSHQPFDEDQRVSMLTEMLRDFAVDDMRPGLPQDDGFEPEFYVDVGLEISAPDHVLHWKTDYHSRVLQVAFPKSNPALLKEAAKPSARFRVDLASQLTAVGGFCYDAKGAKAVNSQEPVIYAVAYSTDKEAYAAKEQDKGLYRKRWANEVLTDAKIKRLMEDVNAIGVNMIRAGGYHPAEDTQSRSSSGCNGLTAQVGAGRLEFRVPLDLADSMHFTLPEGFISEALWAISVEDWW